MLKRGLEKRRQKKAQKICVFFVLGFSVGTPVYILHKYILYKLYYVLRTYIFDSVAEYISAYIPANTAYIAVIRDQTAVQKLRQINRKKCHLIILYLPTHTCGMYVIATKMAKNAFLVRTF